MTKNAKICPSQFKCDVPTGKCQYGIFGTTNPHVVIDPNDFITIPAWDDKSKCITTPIVQEQAFAQMFLSKVCRTGKNYGGGILHGSTCTSDRADVLMLKANKEKFRAENTSGTTFVIRHRLIPRLKDYTPPGGVSSS